MTKYETIALPQDVDGNTYFTEEMMADDDALRQFYERTKECWEYDFDKQVYKFRKGDK